MFREQCDLIMTVMSYRNTEKEDRRKEMRMRRMDRRESLLNHSRNDRVIRDTLEELASDNFNRDADFVKISLKNGKSFWINLNAMPAGERWSTILKLLNHDHLASQDWCDIRDELDTNYTDMVNFLHLGYDDIENIEFSKVIPEITRARLGGAM